MKNINFNALSYVISVLLVYPILNMVFITKNHNIIVVILVYSLAGFFINTGILFLDYKFGVIKKICNFNIFQHYVIFMLRIENCIRTYNFAFGIILGCIGYLLFFILLHDYAISVPKKILWCIYYIIAVYVKIRLSLVNCKLLNIQPSECFKWSNFVNFYELNNTFCKDFNFNNIFRLSFIKDGSGYSNNLKTTKKFITICLGFFTGFFFLNGYQKYIEHIDGVVGIRTCAIRTINVNIHSLQLAVNNENYPPVFRHDSKNDLILFMEVKKKVENLSLLFFLKKKNRLLMDDVYNATLDYGGPFSKQINLLNEYCTILDASRMKLPFSEWFN